MAVQRPSSGVGRPPRTLDPFLPVANGKYRPDRLAYFVGSGPSLFDRTAGGSAGPRLSLVRKCANSNGVTRKKVFVDVR